MRQSVKLKNKMDEKQHNKLAAIDIEQHLLEKGEVYYIDQNFDIQEFINYILKKIQNELKFEAAHNNNDNIHYIRYKGKGGISGSFGFTSTFHLFFMLKDGKLFLDIKHEKWFETGEDKFSIGQLFSTSKYAEIQLFVANKLLESVVSEDFAVKIDNTNHFINEITDKRKLWFYCNSDADEIMLAFLQLSTHQGGNDNVNLDKELVWYFLMSSQHLKLLAFSKRDELVQEFHCQHNKVKVNKELGRNRFTCNDKTFLCLRSNNDMFYEMSKIDLSSNIARVREMARLNWLYNSNKDAATKFALKLLNPIVEEHHLLEDELSVLYIEYSKKNKDELFSLFANDNSLLQLLDKIVVSEETSKWLITWVEKWQIPYVDATAMNDLLMSAVDDAVQANNTLEFHRFVRKQFYHNDKDKINRIWFDIGFCKHLIKSGLLAEAQKILKTNLKHIPDENMSDLLPSKDVDLTHAASGQIIKVNILELLIGIEAEKNAIAHKVQLACLQPLVSSRIDELIKVSEKELSEKGEVLKNVMLPEGLKTTATDGELSALNYEKIDAKLLDKYVRHPMSRKGDHFTKFQKWLASVKSEDYSILKSYSERLSANVHEELHKIVEDITQALDITGLEVYIARGEKSCGISSFEGEPNFLLVGANHLDENSEHYLQPLELRYAIAGELAHLYFNHVRITSSDIWRGAIDKGNTVLDTFLTFIPAVSLFGKSMQGIGKLNSLSSFFQKTHQAGKISDTSRNILTASDQLVKIYQSKKEKTEIDKEKEFWATSRIIQATADRCALIFTKDIKAAVRSILVMSKYYNPQISNIEEAGLNNYLLEKAENGSFLHQELAIRLSNLFSFYLSDDYKSIISKINLKNINTDNQDITEKD